MRIHEFLKNARRKENARRLSGEADRSGFQHWPYHKKERGASLRPIVSLDRDSIKTDAPVSLFSNRVGALSDPGNGFVEGLPKSTHSKDQGLVGLFRRASGTFWNTFIMTRRSAMFLLFELLKPRWKTIEREGVVRHGKLGTELNHSNSTILFISNATCHNLPEKLWQPRWRHMEDWYR